MAMPGIRTTRRLARITIALSAIALSPTLRAEALYDHDNGPLTGIFGIPDSTEGAILAPAGRSYWSAVAITTSHSLLDVAGDETVLFDGETTRLELRYRYGLTDRLELGIEIPYLWHESGGLDSLVDNWHDWFGFPGGFRRARPYDVLEIRYEDGSGPAFDVTGNTNGLGDVRLFAGWKLLDGANHDMALRLGAKFATGDSDDLLGSGGFDYSIGIAGDIRSMFGVDGWTAFYRLHGVGIGEPTFLTDRYRDFAGMVSVGTGFFLGQRVELRLQGALRSELYRSDVHSVGEASGTLTFGGHIHFSDALAMTIAVSEDVKVDSAPDVSFQVGFRYFPD
jgi:hypothetical protein